MIGTVRTVSSLQDEGLDLYRTMRRPILHRRQGLFVAEGEKVAGRLLESDLAVISVLMTPDHLQRRQELLENRPEPITVLVAEKKLLEEIVGFECHQGIMAVGRVPETVPLETFAAQGLPPRLLVATDHLTSAENTGVLVRNCAAFGASGLITGETSADPWLRRSVRNSMGTIFRLAVLYAGNLPESLRMLRADHGFRIQAAHPHDGGRSIYETDFSGDCCIVFGNEGEGISPAVLDACDETVAVPMAKGVDSLNVACASAAILSEWFRRKY
jgi:tRNA G18 (ribose-2'-O)-methylase SpoU